MSKRLQYLHDKATPVQKFKELTQERGEDSELSNLRVLGGTQVSGTPCDEPVLTFSQQGWTLPHQLVPVVLFQVVESAQPLIETTFFIPPVPFLHGSS